MKENKHIRTITYHLYEPINELSWSVVHEYIGNSYLLEFASVVLLQLSRRGGNLFWKIWGNEGLSITEGNYLTVLWFVLDGADFILLPCARYYRIFDGAFFVGFSLIIVYHQLAALFMCLLATWILLHVVIPGCMITSLRHCGISDDFLWLNCRVYQLGYDNDQLNVIWMVAGCRHDGKIEKDGGYFK